MRFNSRLLRHAPAAAVVMTPLGSATYPAPPDSESDLQIGAPDITVAISLNGITSDLASRRARNA
jgi:hypothetical protein